jgi:murein DD-endopeptidase MepM/ murein hydrolase activator NlpD
MLRGTNIIQWRRTIVAVVVACFATISAARLLVPPKTNIDDNSAASDREVAVAGRLDTDVIGDPIVVRPAPDPIEVSLTLDQTRSSKLYLEEAGLDIASADRWQALFSQIAHVRSFEKGHSLTLFRDPETGELRGLRYNLDDRVALTEKTYGAGVVRVAQELIRYTFQPVAVSFKLRKDLSHDAGRLDLPRSILDTLNYAFQDRNSLNNLPRGSDVRLIYQEKVSRDGTQRFATGIQAAMITYRGKTLTAFAFRDESGQPRLYDANGEALEPQSLRFPVNFTYISSGFSFHRYHPILHCYRPHEGVDLAARYGTPVKAVADGTIEEAGWCGELGRCVRIRHEGGVVSIYGHLSQITDGIQPGTGVRVGELIGQVGASGLATGPHLHYGIEKDGHFVNPLDQHLGIHHQVSPRLRQLFDHFKTEYMAALSRLPLGSHYTVALGSTQAAGNAVMSENTTPGSTGRIVQTVTGAVSRHIHVDETAVGPISARGSVMR